MTINTAHHIGGDVYPVDSPEGDQVAEISRNPFYSREWELLTATAGAIALGV